MEQKLLPFFVSPPRFLCSVSFFFCGELSITANVSSIWNMQIADSAFACWCLTFPPGGRSPTQLRCLSAVCLQTPVILPHSTALRQSHSGASHPRCVCFGCSWDGMGDSRVRVGGAARGGGGTNDEGVGSALRRIVLSQQSRKLSLPRQCTTRGFTTF